MKLTKLKSVVNQVLRTSASVNGKYTLDPFEHYTPEIEIEVDLITGALTPDMEGDDVEKFYTSISKWFCGVLSKEGIPIEIIDKAIIKIAPQGKTCIIQAQGREFKATINYK